jgi:copper resistance protein C
MRRLLVLFTAVIGFFAVSRAAADAHAHLRSAVPAVGGTVAVAPHELRLSFTEGVEPVFCRIALSSSHGAVPTGTLSVDPHDAALLIVPVDAKLAPGTYTVAWSAVSVDTHHTAGTYTFRITGR